MRLRGSVSFLSKPLRSLALLCGLYVCSRIHSRVVAPVLVWSFASKFGQSAIHDSRVFGVWLWQRSSHRRQHRQSAIRTKCRISGGFSRQVGFGTCSVLEFSVWFGWSPRCLACGRHSGVATVSVTSSRPGLSYFVATLVIYGLYILGEKLSRNATDKSNAPGVRFDNAAAVVFVLGVALLLVLLPVDIFAKHIYKQIPYALGAR